MKTAMGTNSSPNTPAAAAISFMRRTQNYPPLPSTAHSSSPRLSLPPPPAVLLQKGYPDRPLLGTESARRTTPRAPVVTCSTVAASSCRVRRSNATPAVATGASTARSSETKGAHSFSPLLRRSLLHYLATLFR